MNADPGRTRSPVPDRGPFGPARGAQPATAGDLAAWLASLDDADRAGLVDALRVGAAELQKSRRRNGVPPFDPGPARRLAAAIGGQRWPQTRPIDDGYVTVAESVARLGVSGRTIRRWASSGRIRGRRTAGVWMVHLDDVERERRQR